MMKARRLENKHKINEKILEMAGRHDRLLLCDYESKSAVTMTLLVVTTMYYGEFAENSLAEEFSFTEPVQTMREIYERR